MSSATIRRHISAVHTWFGFLAEEGLVDRDPSDRLETPKRGRTLPDTLSVAEVVRLLEAPGIDERLAWRDRTLLELGYGAGLRVSELCNLALPDLLLGDGLVRAFGKGGKERVVPIGRAVISTVSVYLHTLRPTTRSGRVEEPGAAQRARRAAVAGRGVEHRQEVDPAGRHHQAGDAAHAPPFLCHPSARGRRRPAGACRRCSATPISRPPRSTPTSTATTSGKSTASFTRVASFHRCC